MSLDFSPINYEAHDAKVEKVRKEIQIAKETGERVSIRKNTPTHQIHNATWKDKCHRVDVSELNNILGFKNVENGREGGPAVVAVCESQVQLGQLVKATLPCGYVPKVVPEYNNFTVGGLINGEGIQSSAFKHGLFTQTVAGLEVVLGDGSVQYCSPEDNLDLFAAMPESYGTLGIIVRVEVELRPALPYVRSEYQHFDNVEEFTATFSKQVKAKEGNFLEGLVLAKDSYLIIHSFFDATPSSTLRHRKKKLFDPAPEDNDCGGKYYYQYLRQDVVNPKTKTLAIPEDYIDTYGFLFRSMRGQWWIIETHFGWDWLTNQTWFRKIVDRAAHKHIQSTGGFGHQGHLSPEEMQRCMVLQDMGIRLCRLQEGIEWVQKNISVYPLWICPTNQKTHYKFDPKYFDSTKSSRIQLGDPENEWVCDIGIYGEPFAPEFRHKKVLRELQEFVDFPSCWGVSYEAPDLVRERHRPNRTRFHAEGVFPSVEEKVTFKSGAKAEKEEELQGKIPNWRWVRDHGKYWPYKVGAFLIVFLIVVVGALAALRYLLALVF